MFRSQKEALYETVHRSTLPLKAIADRVGMKPATLSHMALEGDDDEYPFKRLPALFAAADNHALLDYWESIAHRIAFGLPPAGAASSEAQQELLAAMDALGDTVKVDRETRKDGHFSIQDKRDCVRAARRVMEAAKRYIASLDDEVAHD